jgi:hypothetical protein
MASYKRGNACTQAGWIDDAGKMHFYHEYEKPLGKNYEKCKHCGSTKSIPKWDSRYTKTDTGSSSTGSNSGSSSGSSSYSSSWRSHNEQTYTCSEPGCYRTFKTYTEYTFHRVSHRINSDRYGSGSGTSSWRASNPDSGEYRYDSSKPVQIQIIEFLAMLHKKQSLGFSDGEILTMWTLAKKKAETKA